DLRRDYDFIALIRERFCDQLFAQTIPVGISRIEQRNPEIKRLVHQRNRFTLGKISPPAGGNCPQPEADFTDCEIGILVSAKAHEEYFNHRDHRGHGELLVRARAIFRAKPCPRTKTKVATLSNVATSCESVGRR